MSLLHFSFQLSQTWEVFLLTECQDLSPPPRTESFSLEETITYHFSMDICMDDECKLTGAALHTYKIIKI